VFTYCLPHTVPLKFSKLDARLSCEKKTAPRGPFNRHARVVPWNLPKMSNYWLELVPRKARGTFVVHFVGALCRKWPETARFDKVFDKGSRQSGLNGWFWDKL